MNTEQNAAQETVSCIDWLDAGRLDWWIERTRYHQTVRVYECETPKSERYWCCEITQPYRRFSGRTPREAIDNAMATEENQ